MQPSTFINIAQYILNVSQYFLKCILVLSHMYPSTFSNVSQYFLKCILVHSQMYPSTFSNVSQYFLKCILVLSHMQPSTQSSRFENDPSRFKNDPSNLTNELGYVLGYKGENPKATKKIFKNSLVHSQMYPSTFSGDS